MILPYCTTISFIYYS